ncbi:MAG: RloB domain-containing protein [Bacteroidia bacterium]|nr:RloB domain-containing protein [Bacteroidia bacterium]
MRKNKKISFDKGKTSIYPIVVDGKTEKWYFQMLKRNEPELRVAIKPELSCDKTLDEQYNLVCDLLGKEYSMVFWIIDLDVIIKETKECKKGIETPIKKLTKYIDKINDLNNDKEHNNKVIIIINNPCLEYWILLHYILTTRQFNNCVEVTKNLKQHLKDYEKTEKYYTQCNNDIFLKLKNNLKKAISHSKNLGQFDKNSAEKPISEMWKFFHEEPFKTHFDIS